MPIISERDILTGDPLQLPQGPPNRQVPTEEDTFTAIFEETNPIAASLKFGEEFGDEHERLRSQFQGPRDPNFDLLEHVPQHHDKYLDFYVQYAETPREAELAKDYIDNLLKAQQTIEEGGIYGYTAGLLAGVLTDPTILIPGTAAFKAIRFGLRGQMAASSAASAVLSGGGVGASEVLLHRVQPTRTKEESVLAVTSAALLGALIGPATRLLSEETLRVAQHELKGEMRGGNGSGKYVLDEETGEVTMNRDNTRNKVKFTKDESGDCP